MRYNVGIVITRSNTAGDPEFPHWLDELAPTVGTASDAYVGREFQEQSTPLWLVVINGHYWKITGNRRKDSPLEGCLTQLLDKGCMANEEDQDGASVPVSIGDRSLCALLKGAEKVAVIYHWASKLADWNPPYDAEHSSYSTADADGMSPVKCAWLKLEELLGPESMPIERQAALTQPLAHEISWAKHSIIGLLGPIHVDLQGLMEGDQANPAYVTEVVEAYANPDALHERLYEVILLVHGCDGDGEVGAARDQLLNPGSRNAPMSVRRIMEAASGDTAAVNGLWDDLRQLVPAPQPDEDPLGRLKQRAPFLECLGDRDRLTRYLGDLRAQRRGAKVDVEIEDFAKWFQDLVRALDGLREALGSPETGPTT